jgi:predicted RND superfamily exporter protein/pimeloyl-ACP methyl ester carboxylesterase
MEAPRTKVFGPARIVALALISLAALSLAYLHFGAGNDPVSVPSGAHAGQLKLHPCHYATENGSYRADCGTLVVQENRHNARSRLIALPVTRIHARSAEPGVPIFRLEGGPGLSNMNFENASRLADKRDVVLVGYRGVDGLTKLDCPEVDSARLHARDFVSNKSFRADAAAFKACAQRLQDAGVDLGGYTLPERVDDLDAARRALGYDRIDLLSESAGTRTAMIYAWRYPKRIHRSVMIGVNPPGAFLWDAKTTGEQIDRYAALCAKDVSCKKRTPDLAASLHSAYAHIPARWLFLPIRKGNVKAAAFFGLMNETADGAGPLAAPKTIDTLLSIDEGDASGAWFLSLVAQLAFPRAQVWGDVAAVGRSDAAYARRFFATHADRGSVIGSPGTDLVWAGGRLLDSWPASPDENEYTHVRDSNVETLLVGGTLDLATPPQKATRELLPHLSNGHQVVLSNLGHTDDFWSFEPVASKRLVNTFFDRGRVDTSLYTDNVVDFKPFSHGAIAKILLGVMLVFAALTVLSLLWMPLRVRRRGAFGRKSRGALRSLYALLLGLGGWFVGVLIVLTALPTVPLDDELLAALSVGVPIGLGLFFAWVNRDWSSTTKTIGLAAAAGGALVGAWLGFQATEGLFALVTSIVGAVVGGNLTLLALDVGWDRQARSSYLSRSRESSLGTSSTPTLLRRPRDGAVIASEASSNEGETSMSRARQHSNIVARMGRWSAGHWKTATFGWLAFMIAAFAVGGVVGTKTADPNKAGPGESGRMDRILDAGFKQPAGESVLIQSRSVRVGDPGFTAAIEDVVARVSKVAAVQDVRSPLAPGNAGQIAKGKDAALVEFDIRGDKNKAGEKIGPVLKNVADAQRAHPGFFIGEFGDASAAHAVDTVFAHDLKSAGVYSIPLTLLILVLAFGALVAAGIPLLLGLTAVFTTFGLVALPSHLLPVANEAFAVVLLVGLAVGVDYSMFYLRREREERAAGRSKQAALEAAAATSGRSVLVSGLTVMVAMAGLFLTGDATFASFGYATMIVVAVAVLGSLTVLPALLSKLGDRVDRLRVPLVGRLRRDDGEGRIWGAIVDRVLRRPLLSAVVSGGLLLAIAAPALHMRIATPGPEAAFPKSLDIVKTYDRMQQAFPGTALPADVVVKAPDVGALAVRGAIDRLEQRALASGQMGEPITVDVNNDATVARITVPIAGTGTDPASNTALAELRDTIVPETVGALSNTQVGVTGLTAEWKDQGDQMKSTLPIVVAFVLLFAFGLMLVSFRSIVIAFKAILLNVLSVAAAYGVLVLVFQDGYGKGLLGFNATAGISPVVPLLLFVILFGLSMDYHVFIVSRIRETFDRGASMDDAIAHGIKSTAGVVTSAAIVMVAVFSIFATLSLLMFKQFGVGLAVAILLDATLVRGVLLPATMKLLGERNWYLPGWLQWLPRFEPEESSTVPETASVPVSA